MFVPTSLVDYLTYSAQKFPEKIALIVNDVRLSYREVNDLTQRIAQSLCELGLQRGDRVVVCLDNRVETILIFWAILKVGGVASVVHPDMAKKKLSYIVQDSGAKILFVKESPVIINDVNELLKYVDHVILLDKTIMHEKLIDYHSLFQAKSAVVKVKTLDIDLATIIYTSGSTGLPKGVMLTHRAMLTASVSIGKYLTLDAQDIIISGLPLSFDYGLYQVILSFLMSATIIIEKDFSWPMLFLKKMAAEKATVFPGVATMFSILMNHAGKINFDFSALRSVTNTGAILLSRHISLIKSLFPSANIYSMYGLTECKRCTYLPPSDIDKKPGSVGIAIPNTEMWLVDDQDKRVGVKEIGQLVIRGATLMLGYWNKPLESERVLKNGTLPGEKVLYTGDYGYLDEDGYFYFCGRIDEVVKRYGEKVSLREIEEIIYQYSGVHEVAVVDLPDEATGSTIIAFVSSAQHGVLTKEEIVQHCQKLLAKSHWPKDIFIFPELPKNSNGKLDKTALKEWCAQSAI